MNNNMQDTVCNFLKELLGGVAMNLKKNSSSRLNNRTEVYT